MWICMKKLLQSEDAINLIHGSDVPVSVSVIVFREHSNAFPPTKKWLLVNSRLRIFFLSWIYRLLIGMQTEICSILVPSHEVQWDYMLHVTFIAYPIIIEYYPKNTRDLPILCMFIFIFILFCLCKFGYNCFCGCNKSLVNSWFHFIKLRTCIRFCGLFIVKWRLKKKRKKNRRTDYCTIFE